MSYQKKASILNELEQAIKRKAIDKSKNKESSYHLLQQSLENKKRKSKNSYPIGRHGPSTLNELHKDRDSETLNSATSSGVGPLSKNKAASIFNHQNLMGIESHQSKQKKQASRQFQKLMSFINYVIGSSDKVIRFVDHTNFQADFAVKLYKSDKQQLLQLLKHFSFQKFKQLSNRTSKANRELQQENILLRKEIQTLENEAFRYQQDNSQIYDNALLKTQCFKLREAMRTMAPGMLNLLEKETKIEMMALESQTDWQAAQIMQELAKEKKQFLATFSGFSQPYKIKEIQEEKHAIQLQVAALKQKLNKLNECSDSMKENKTMKIALQSLQCDYITLKTNQENLLKHIKQLIKDLKIEGQEQDNQWHNWFSRIYRHVKDIEDEATTLRESLSTLQLKAKKCQADSQLLRRENQAVKSQLQLTLNSQKMLQRLEEQTQNSRAYIEGLEADKSWLLAQKDKDNAHIKQLTQKIEQLQAQYQKEQTQLKAENKQAKQENQQLRQNISIFEKRQQQINLEMIKKSQKFRDLQIDAQNREKKISQLDKDLQTLNDKLNGSKAAAECKQEIIGQLNVHNAELNQSLKLLQNQLQELKKSFKSQSVSLESQNSTIKTELNTVKNQFNQLTNSFVQLKILKECIQTQKSELDTKFDALKTQNSKLNKQSNCLKSQLNQFINQKNNLNNQKENLKNQNNHLTNQLNQLIEQIKCLKNQNQELKSEVISYKQEAELLSIEQENLKQQHIKKQQNLKQQHDSLLKYIEELKNKNDLLKIQVQNLIQKNGQSHCKDNQIQTQVSKDQEQNAFKLQQSQLQNETLEIQCKERQQLHKLEKLVSELTQQLQINKQKLKTALQNKDSYYKELSELRGKVQLQQSEISLIQKKLNDLQTQVKEQSIEIITSMELPIDSIGSVSSALTLIKDWVFKTRNTVQDLCAIQQEVQKQRALSQSQRIEYENKQKQYIAEIDSQKNTIQLQINKAELQKVQLKKLNDQIEIKQQQLRKLGVQMSELKDKGHREHNNHQFYIQELESKVQLLKEQLSEVSHSYKQQVEEIKQQNLEIQKKSSKLLERESISQMQQKQYRCLVLKILNGITTIDVAQELQRERLCQAQAGNRQELSLERVLEIGVQAIMRYRKQVRQEESNRKKIRNIDGTKEQSIPLYRERKDAKQTAVQTIKASEIRQFNQLPEEQYPMVFQSDSEACRDQTGQQQSHSLLGGIDAQEIIGNSILNQQKQFPKNENKDSQQSNFLSGKSSSQQIMQANKQKDIGKCNQVNQDNLKADVAEVSVNNLVQQQVAKELQDFNQCLQDEINQSLLSEGQAQHQMLEETPIKKIVQIQDTQNTRLDLNGSILPRSFQQKQNPTKKTDGKEEKGEKKAEDSQRQKDYEIQKFELQFADYSEPLNSSMVSGKSQQKEEQGIDTFLELNNNSINHSIISEGALESAPATNPAQFEQFGELGQDSMNSSIISDQE